MLQPADSIQRNLKVIREYLMATFQGFGMWDEAEPPICQKFILTNPKTMEEFKLKVMWGRICDGSIDGETLRRFMVAGDVAGKLREERYYYW